MIKIFYSCIAGSTWKVSNCEIWRVLFLIWTSTCSTWWVQHFLILIFDGSFVSSFPKTYVARLIVVFQFYCWYYWVLGDLESEVLKFLFFSLNGKSIIAFFSINCFSKVDTLFFESATTNWESLTWEWEWWVFEDISAETLSSSSNLVWTDLLEFWKIIFPSGKCFGKIMSF